MGSLICLALFEGPCNDESAATNVYSETYCTFKVINDYSPSRKSSAKAFAYEQAYTANGIVSIILAFPTFQLKLRDVFVLLHSSLP